MDVFEGRMGQKNIFFSEYPINFDRNCAITLFFWDINLDFKESQRREIKPLLDDSGNWVSQKNGIYLGPQSSTVALQL